MAATVVCGLRISGSELPGAASLDLGEFDFWDSDRGFEPSGSKSSLLCGLVFSFWRAGCPVGALRLSGLKLPALDALGSSRDGEEDIVVNEA